MTFPSNPSNGATHKIGSTDFTYNSTSNQWKGVVTTSSSGGGGSSSVSLGSTAPTSPAAGQMWYDESLGRLFIWSSSAWIDTSPR